MGITLPEGWQPEHLAEAEQLPSELRDSRVYTDLAGFDGYLRSFANKVKQGGLITKGQFVAAGADQLFRNIKTSPRNQQRVKDFLARLQS